MRWLSLTAQISLFWPAVAWAEDAPWNAADAHYDRQAMAEARQQLQRGHGGMNMLYLQTERLEFRTNQGDPLLLWDAQAWYGGDIDKAWIKTEGEYRLDDGGFEEAELQALYSRAITAYFDLQVGLRHDFRPGPSRSFAVIGVQGLAPYWFEVDAAAFLSEDGDLSLRLELEQDLLLTQRLILAPRLELNIAFQDSPRQGIGRGLSGADAGIRLRYEFDRRFAPYIGISWSRKLGDTADFARAEGEDTGGASFVAGMRLWF